MMDVPGKHPVGSAEVQSKGKTPVSNGRGFSFPQPSPDPLPPVSLRLNRYAVPMIRVHTLAPAINHGRAAPLAHDVRNFPTSALTV